MSHKSQGQPSTLIESTPKRSSSKWDVTPLVKHDLNSDLNQRITDRTPNRSDQTPSRFSETPLRKGEQPQTPRRWDDKTPMNGGATPSYAGMTPTPNALKTPDILNMTPKKLELIRWER